MALLYWLGLIIVPHLLMLNLLVWQCCSQVGREDCLSRLSYSLTLARDVEALAIQTTFSVPNRLGYENSGTPQHKDRD